jgi:hypothetical protein
MAVQVVAGMLTGLFLGTMPATLVEMFPTKTRQMGLSTSFNASTGLFGGFARSSQPGWSQPPAHPLPSRFLWRRRLSSRWWRS